MAQQFHPDLRCYYHPERKATSQCDRCGDYLCGECMHEWEKEQLCKVCLKDVSSPCLGPPGKLACIINLATAAAFVPLLFLGAVLAEERNPLAPVLCSLVLIAAFASAGLLARRERPPALAGARLLLDSIWNTSLAGLVGSLIGLFVMLVLLFEPSSPRHFSGFLTTMIPPMALGGVLLALAVNRWARAVRRGVKPLWVVVVSLLSTLVGIGVFGLFGFLQLLGMSL